jgi:hypothetical protein
VTLSLPWATRTSALHRVLPATRTLFEERFGRLDVPIRDFMNGPGSHVTILNLEERLPDLFAPLSSP